MSKYAAGLIRQRSQFGGWPNGYWESVYGALDDETFVVGEEDATLDESLDDTCDWLGDDHVSA